MSESDWASEKAVDAVYCAEPCPLEPSCDEAPQDDRCHTCLTNDRIVFRVTAALRSAREEGFREAVERGCAGFRGEIAKAQAVYERKRELGVGTPWAYLLDRNSGLAIAESLLRAMTPGGNDE